MLSLDPQLFLSVFALIFLAEIPDKTSFATLLLATRKNPYALFIGVAAAFVVQSVIAVCFGSLFGLFPKSDVRIAAGGLFLLFALAMWFRKEAEDEEGKLLNAGETTIEADRALRRKAFRQTVTGSFMVIFLAEWGDLTQLATVALEAKYRNPATILSASILALWCVTALAIIVGNRARKMLDPALLQKIAAIAFAAVGVLILLHLG